MVCRTLNPVSSAIVPYKYEKYSSPTDMYEKYHLVSSTYLPRLNKGEAKVTCYYYCKCWTLPLVHHLILCQYPLTQQSFRVFLLILVF